MESHQQARLCGCDLPAWVRALVSEPRGSVCVEPIAGEIDLSLQVCETDDHAVLSCFVEDASGLDSAALRRSVDCIYDAIGRRCDEAPVRRFPLRYWNFLPGIHEPMTATLDRYRVFNLGRHDAMSRRSGCSAIPDGFLPTATAVGHRADCLIIHCLTGAQPPINLENPRQIPAYRYSATYGPRPPCFSRASIASIRGQRLLLVGGTSSVRGERSVHLGDVRRQLDETLGNLRCVVETAMEAGGRAGKASEHLAGFRRARAYYAAADERDWLESELRCALPNVEEIEFLQAELCRAELRIEIEGVVALG